MATDKPPNIQLMDLKANLDGWIRYWVDVRRDGDGRAHFYIDAFQTIREKTFGERLEGIGDETKNESPTIRDRVLRDLKAVLSHDATVSFFAMILSRRDRNEDEVEFFPTVLTVGTENMDPEMRGKLVQGLRDLAAHIQNE